MSNLDKPLGEQFYPLWKAVGINDTTFQIKGRFDKESESAGTKYKVGKQVFCFSLRDERTKQERFYMDVSSDPTLIDAAEGVYEYTIASVDHRGIQSDNTVTPPTKYSSSNRKTHAAGQYVGIVVSPEYFSEVQEDFIAASTIATAVAGENLVANNTVSLHTDGKLYKYHFTNYPNVVGFVASAYTAPATATYTTFGGVATGLTGLTPGATLFAENTGAYTHTGSSTTTPIGKALTTTTARLYLTSTEIVKATESEARAGTDNANYMTPLRTYQAIQEGEMIYAADAEASDTYVITLTPAPTAYTTGMRISFKANTANTGAATLNVNTIGAKTIKKRYNVDLDTNDILANQIVTVIYDGTNFQMQSPAGQHPYMCEKSYASANYTNATNSFTIIPVGLDGQYGMDFNPNSSIFTFASNRITVVQAGTYYLRFSGLMSTIEGASSINFYKNGVSINTYSAGYYSASGYQATTCSAVLAAGDYIEVFGRGYSSSGGTLTIEKYRTFTITKTA